jgi:hypothetical protein
MMKTTLTRKASFIALAAGLFLTASPSVGEARWSLNPLKAFRQVQVQRALRAAGLKSSQLRGMSTRPRRVGKEMKSMKQRVDDVRAAASMLASQAKRIEVNSSRRRVLFYHPDGTQAGILVVSKEGAGTKIKLTDHTTRTQWKVKLGTRSKREQLTAKREYYETSRRAEMIAEQRTVKVSRLVDGVLEGSLREKVRERTVIASGTVRRGGGSYIDKTKVTRTWGQALSSGNDKPFNYQVTDGAIRPGPRPGRSYEEFANAPVDLKLYRAPNRDKALTTAAVNAGRSAATGTGGSF